ncbi:MAG: hypothetical protein J0L99_00015 [Chitinophagales bacterium]|nr:hypothetical protein [Chitinophagales bacterium]
MRHYLWAFALSFAGLSACGQQSEALNIAAGSADAASLSSNKNTVDPIAATGIIFRSADGGLSWEDVSGGLPNQLPVSRVYTDGENITLSAEGGLFRSPLALGVPMWKQVAETENSKFIIQPGRKTNYAIDWETALKMEVPGTGLWMPIDKNLPEKAVHTIYETQAGHLLIGTRSGIFKSTDNGASWKQVLADFESYQFIEQQGSLLCTSFQGLVRSTDGGEHWEPLLKDISIYHIKQVNSKLIALSEQGDVCKLISSNDQGKSWETICTMPIRQISDIAMAGNTLFYSHKKGISRSFDNGKTWELVYEAYKEDQFIIFGVSGSLIFAISGIGC